MQRSSSVVSLALTACSTLLLLLSGSSLVAAAQHTNIQLDHAKTTVDVECQDVPSTALATPVCGSDHNTYSSLAALHCANNGSALVTVVYQGKCEDPCWQAISPVAPKEGSPICGSDGVVYPSSSVLKCVSQQPNQENLTAVAMEKCSTNGSQFDPCVLLAYVAPRKICGSDNVTYNNVWHMICTSAMYEVDIKLQHEGECDIKCPYSPIYNPVCSTSEYMYANIEALKCRQTLSPYIKNELHHHGHCARHLNRNPCYVDNSYNPVCASNGRTYSSPQYVRCLKDGNPGLDVLHSGPCSVPEVRGVLGATGACALAADQYEWNPVCGSDNVTYGNPFRFFCSTLNRTTDLSVAYTGECGGFDYCRIAEDDSAPSEVCANDGITYRSLRALYCAQSSKRHLHLSHAGACSETDDPCLYRGVPFLDNNGSPVCASNGVTYVSIQAAWCAAKTDPGIEFKHDGECF